MLANPLYELLVGRRQFDDTDVFPLRNYTWQPLFYGGGGGGSPKKKKKSDRSKRSLDPVLLTEIAAFYRQFNPEKGTKKQARKLARRYGRGKEATLFEKLRAQYPEAHEWLADWSTRRRKEDETKDEPADKPE